MNFHEFIFEINFEIVRVLLFFNHLQILFFFKTSHEKKNLVTYQFNLDSNKIIFLNLQQQQVCESGCNWC